MADPNRTPPQKDRNPQDEDLFRQEGERQRLRRERSVANEQGERIRRRRTGDDEPLDEVTDDVVDEIEDEGLGRSDR